MEHKWHAEEVSWPLKKAGKRINGNDKIVEVDFSAPAGKLQRAA